MQLHRPFRSFRASLFTRNATACALAASAISLFAAVPASAQVTEPFGYWEGLTTQKFYVSPTGGVGNPGTLLQPVPSITEALRVAAPFLGVVPVTINVVDSTYSQSTGEVFPIALPAYGVTIEAHFTSLANGPRVVAAPGLTVPEIFFFDTVGNPELPRSTLRGLEIRNGFQVAGSADIRIDVPGIGAKEPVLIAPEIRDCLLTGEPFFGIQMTSREDTLLEPVIERNHITGVDPFFGVAGVDIVGGEGTSSPLIRCNRIDRYQTNLRMMGGGLTNQPRIQSNFIQIGNVNVDVDDCAPFIVNNTIAFASATIPQQVIGLRWVNVPEMTLSNNVLWNPDWNGNTGVDVSGNLAVFANAPRNAWFNMDEDNTLFNATLASVPGVVTIWDVTVLGGPDFVGGNLPGTSAATPVDLHLTDLSNCIGAGFDMEVVSIPSGVRTAILPTAAGTRTVRIDVGYDADFDGRIEGSTGMVNAVDLGADEFVGIFAAGPAASPTRGAVLMPTGAPTFGVAMDALGNLRPDSNGQWNSQINVVGQTGDFVMILVGTGFTDLVPDPAAPGVLVENRSIYQNALFVGLFPTMGTEASFGLELGANTFTWVSGTIPTGGVLQANVTLGAFNPAFTEAELQIQAIVLDPTSSFLQTTNRLTLELNQ